MLPELSGSHSGLHLQASALVAASGSFNLNLITDRGQQTVALLLKVGIKQIFPASTGEPEAPAFAYLQSANGTTANSVLADMESDTPGYRIYALKADTDVFALIGAILEGAPVALYFNRSAKGTDVKVPLDFMVVDSKSTAGGVEAIRSDSTLVTFRACFAELARSLK